MSIEQDRKKETKSGWVSHYLKGCDVVSILSERHQVLEASDKIVLVTLNDGKEF
jgi:hypothetical protein